MDMKGLMDKTRALTESATGLAGTLLDDFNQALPTVHALGLTVRDLNVALAVPPEVGAKLIGAVEDINTAKLAELVEAHPDKKTLLLVLKGLQTAYHLKDQLHDLPHRSIEDRVQRFFVEREFDACVVPQVSVQ